MPRAATHSPTSINFLLTRPNVCPFWFAPCYFPSSFEHRKRKEKEKKDHHNRLEVRGKSSLSNFPNDHSQMWTHFLTCLPPAPGMRRHRRTGNDNKFEKQNENNTSVMKIVLLYEKTEHSSFGSPRRLSSLVLAAATGA